MSRGKCDGTCWVGYAGWWASEERVERSLGGLDLSEDHLRAVEHPSPSYLHVFHCISHPSAARSSCWLRC